MAGRRRARRRGDADVRSPRAGPAHPFVLVACFPIAVMRRWPLPVLAVAAAAASVEMVCGGASLPLGLLLGLATYLVATQLPRRVSIRAGIAVAAALGVALVYATFNARRVPLAAKAVEGFLPLVAA